jgi:hypothetical protein
VGKACRAGKPVMEHNEQAFVKLNALVLINL